MLVYRGGRLASKCLRELAPDYLAKRFKTRSEIHNRDTRNKNKIDTPGYRTAARKKGPFIIWWFHCGTPYPKGSLI